MGLFRESLSLGFARDIDADAQAFSSRNRDKQNEVIADLQAALKNYEAAMSYQRGYEEKRNKDLRSLNTAYANQVSGLIKRLTSDGKIEDAVKIQKRYGSRIDGWSTSSRVLFKDASKGPKGDKA